VVPTGAPGLFLTKPGMRHVCLSHHHASIPSVGADESTDCRKYRSMNAERHGSEEHGSWLHESPLPLHLLFSARESSVRHRMIAAACHHRLTKSQLIRIGADAPPKTLPCRKNADHDVLGRHGHTSSRRCFCPLPSIIVIPSPLRDSRTHAHIRWSRPRSVETISSTSSLFHLPCGVDPGDSGHGGGT
jgi:hypothetical protein